MWHIWLRTHLSSSHIWLNVLPMSWRYCETVSDKKHIPCTLWLPLRFGEAISWGQASERQDSWSYHVGGAGITLKNTWEHLPLTSWLWTWPYFRWWLFLFTRSTAEVENRTHLAQLSKRNWFKAYFFFEGQMQWGFLFSLCLKIYEKLITWIVLQWERMNPWLSVSSLAIFNSDVWSIRWNLRS